MLFVSPIHVVLGWVSFYDFFSVLSHCTRRIPALSLFCSNLTGLDLFCQDLGLIFSWYGTQALIIPLDLVVSHGQVYDNTNELTAIKITYIYIFLLVHTVHVLYSETRLCSVETAALVVS